MTSVVTALSTSLDGFIAGPDDSSELPLGRGGERLFRWFRDGDTPSRFYPAFVTEGIERAVELARGAAGQKDVALMGAQVVQQALRVHLLDELVIHVVPVILGGGVRLLDRLDSAGTELELERVVDAPGVTT